MIEALCFENCGGVHAGAALSDELDCPDCRGTRWTLPTLPPTSSDN